MHTYSTSTHQRLLLWLMLLSVSSAQAQGVTRYNDVAAFRANAQNLTSIDFEGLPGSSDFPFVPGKQLHSNRTSTGIKVADVRFLGETSSYGYETWLTTASADGGVYSMNGSANLMGGRHRLRIFLPFGVTTFAMEVGRANTPGSNRADIYVKLRTQGTGIQFPSFDLQPTPRFVGFTAAEEIEHVDVFPNVQTGLIPYIILDNLLYGGATVTPAPEPESRTVAVYATSDSAVIVAGGTSRPHESCGVVSIPDGYGYLSHSIYISTANPSPPGGGKTDSASALIPGAGGHVRQVALRVRAWPEGLGAPRNWLGASLTVVMQLGTSGPTTPSPSTDISCAGVSSDSAVSVASVTFEPNNDVTAGMPVTMKVRLTRPAPAGGTTVGISHFTHTGTTATLVNEPVSIKILQGNSEGTIVMQTRRVTTDPTRITFTAFTAAGRYSEDLTIR